MPDNQLPDILIELQAAVSFCGGLAIRAAEEIKLLRYERDQFERAWSAVSDRYESLLNQLGGTDA